MPDFKDVQPPKLIKTTGAHHPINHMKDSIMNLFISIGFEVKDGPEIETDSFNFGMFIKKSHPARQMHDTFYVNKKSNVLRTHTSPVQIRGMLENKPLMHLYLEVRYIEKMMIQLTYQCFIRLRVYMLIKE